MTPPRDPAFASSPLLQRVTVRLYDSDRAQVSVALPHIHLAGLWARRSADGRVKLETPSATDGEAPPYQLQPGFAEQIADAVAILWDEAADAALVARLRRAAGTIH
jgi:hypothetical protein